MFGKQQAGRQTNKDTTRSSFLQKLVIQRTSGGRGRHMRRSSLAELVNVNFD